MKKAKKVARMKPWKGWCLTKDGVGQPYVYADRDTAERGKAYWSRVARVEVRELPRKSR